MLVNQALRSARYGQSLGENALSLPLPVRDE